MKEKREKKREFMGELRHGKLEYTYFRWFVEHIDYLYLHINGNKCIQVYLSKFSHKEFIQNTLMRWHLKKKKTEKNHVQVVENFRHLSGTPYWGMLALVDDVCDQGDALVFLILCALYVWGGANVAHFVICAVFI